MTIPIANVASAIKPKELGEVVKPEGNGHNPNGILKNGLPLIDKLQIDGTSFAGRVSPGRDRLLTVESTGEGYTGYVLQPLYQCFGDCPVLNSVVFPGKYYGIPDGQEEVSFRVIQQNGRR